MICIIDGPYLTYRAYCAGGLDGMYRGALSTLFELGRLHDELWIVWEHPEGKGNALRRDLYPEYKSRREPKPIEYLTGADQIARIARDCGWNQAIPVEGEADDAARTLAECHCADGVQVRLWGRDKDWMQLLTLPGVSMLLPPTSGLAGAVEITAVDVPRILGVPADRVVDLLALAGDTSDDVPGMPRIGLTRAKALIAACHHLVDLILAGHGDEAVEHVARDNASLAPHAQACADRADLLRTMVDLVTLQAVEVVRTAGVLDVARAEAGLRAIDCGWAQPHVQALVRDDWCEDGPTPACPPPTDDWSE